MSNPIPNQLALTSIADDAAIIASDHRNNYAAIQSAVNELIVAWGVTAKGDLVVATASGQVQVVSVGSNGQVLTADSTQPAGVKWASVATPSGTQLDYAQITADVTGITATTEGTAVAVVTGNSVAYDGTKVRLEFQCSGVTPTGDDLHWVVLRDATVLGQIGVASNVQGAGLGFALYDTPTVASHVYKVAAFTGGAQTMAVKAGAGGSGNLLPAFLRVTKA